MGYTGGDAKDPGYRRVCSGSTGHAEATRIEFDPSKVTYAELVRHSRLSMRPLALIGLLVAANPA